MKKEPQSSCHTCSSRGHSIFSDLGDAGVDCLEVYKTSNLYKKGQILFHEGATPLGLFCLKDGKAKIYKTGADGREQIVRLASEGDVLGYRALLSDEPYHASAAVLEDTAICFIDRQHFRELFKNQPSLSKNLIDLLSLELKEAENLIRDMAQKSVRERLAEVLLILKNKFGCEDADSAVLNVSLSREELASFVGTATETLIRLLSDMKTEGLIDTQGKKIHLKNLQGLIQLAGLED